MGYSRPDPYYQPEKFGLIPLGELDDPHANYSFDYLVVWNHPETHTLYWGSDAGCSCPSPFEGFSSLDALNAVAYGDVEGLKELELAIRNHCLYTNDKIARARVNLLETIRVVAGEW